jgi:hypothetical protein
MASQTQALYYVFYLGLVCMLFFYNLAIFIITREKEYFYYVCWIFFSIIYFMILKGYAVQIFPESLHFLNTSYKYLFIGCRCLHCAVCYKLTSFESFVSGNVKMVLCHFSRICSGFCFKSFYSNFTLQQR